MSVVLVAALDDPFSYSKQSINGKSIGFYLFKNSGWTGFLVNVNV